MLLLHDILVSLAQQHMLALADQLQLPEGPATQQHLAMIGRASIAKRWLIVDAGKTCTVYMLLRS